MAFCVPSAHVNVLSRASYNTAQRALIEDYVSTMHTHTLRVVCTHACTPLLYYYIMTTDGIIPCEPASTGIRAIHDQRPILVSWVFGVMMGIPSRDMLIPRSPLPIGRKGIWGPVHLLGKGATDAERVLHTLLRVRTYYHYEGPKGSHRGLRTMQHTHTLRVVCMHACILTYYIPS
jgi:hypothetical protein